MIDAERRSLGFSKQVEGSASVSDVLMIFDEVLASSLADEVGEGLRSETEIPSWTRVRDVMEPVWKLWPAFASTDPLGILATKEWSALERVVAEVVVSERLWCEEIDYPVTLVDGGVNKYVPSWDELEQFLVGSIGALKVFDERGRPLEFSLEPPLALTRVGLPKRSQTGSGDTNSL